ncbi:PTS sugar transporter subunit IIA [Klebsiella quasipneumoniae]|uniref:PTS sugar transporter subunit IIA n=1 Tax=Klebsiella quasipneumoniae TaxID=1463165 RepID=UPI001495A661|nr:PTS sugar transporter subunit IIA [Klebsiella quasipneumoniae]
MDIIFDPTLIALKQNISHAEEAIELAGSLLARRQICSAEYVSEMLTVYEDFGAAIVIDDGIAMPHARPEKGALQTGFSLVTTATPVTFGHDEFDPVTVVIAIAGAGADADSHIKMIQLIASLIESDIVTFLQQETDVNSILHFIQKQME